MSSFWSNIWKNQKTRETGLRSILKKIPLFEQLSGKELETVEQVLHRREYRPDEVIFHQGDMGVGMYIIQEGKVAIIYEPTGQELAELSDGDFFGELALLDESPRSAMAVARTPCKIWGMFQSDLFGLIERNPRLGLKIVLPLARIIGERLKHSNKELLSVKEELFQLKQKLEEKSEIHDGASRQ